MPRLNFNSKNIRKLTKVGGGRSYSITLPIDIVKEFGWKEKQKLIVKKSGSKIIIFDWEK